MGAILSNFPALPLDADPQRVSIYTRVYAQLTELGLALPGTPANTVTRAVLLAHLQALAGQIIKDELTANPDVLDYTGTDAATAIEVNRAYAPPQGRRWPGSNATGYRTLIGGTLLGLVAELNPGGGDPGFTGPVFEALTSSNALIRFRPTTTTVLLRGVARQITLAAASNQLNLAGPLPVIAAVGDVFDIATIHLSIVLPARLNQILRGLPFSPNVLTAADITAAKL